ncbi:MAG TPA: S8 family serine peptidase [Patescibacteria group bacterium]|nr:S8 family serine peptidase [Patescibacteria group bacterium]
MNSEKKSLLNLAQIYTNLVARHRYILRLIILVAILTIGFLVFLKISSSKKQTQTAAFDYFAPRYVPDELIVNIRNEYTATELSSLKIMFDQLGIIGQDKAYVGVDFLQDYYILKFKPGTDLRRAKDVLDKSGFIGASHPNYIFKIEDSPPTDSYYSTQWNLFKINAEGAWRVTHGSNNVKVAIIDTGIDYNHPDFSGRSILKGPNFIACPPSERSAAGFCQKTPEADVLDDQGHGTHVAGTIGAIANNGIGIAGINWNITLMAIKSMDQKGDGNMNDIISGMNYAVQNKANVINLSLTSGPGSNLPCRVVPELQATIDNAISHGVVVVAAAGNESEDALMESPPSCTGLIVVGATDQNDDRASFSNYGSRIDISAPGVAILSTFTNPPYQLDQGTSMAAPHVAAVAALLLAANPSLSATEVKNCLINNADSIRTDKPIGGRLNAAKALVSCTPSPQSQPTVSPSTSQKSTSVIKGSVYIDSNNNGAFDASESGYSGATIDLDGAQSTNTTSDSTGSYSFKNLAQGNYKVSLVIDGKTVGYSPNFPLPADFTAKISFPLPASYLLKPSTSALTSQGATKTQALKVSPTPIKTYTCRAATGTNKKGGIQIGNLICTPNT